MTAPGFLAGGQTLSSTLLSRACSGPCGIERFCPSCNQWLCVQIMIFLPTDEVFCMQAST